MVRGVTMALGVLLVSFGQSSCSGAGPERPPVPDTAGKSESGQGAPPVQLRLDQALAVDGLVLNWISVADSRCPEGVMCGWAGEATVRIRVRDGAEDHEIALTLGPRPGDGVVKTSRHEYRLVALEPYPRHDTPVARNAHRATVAVKRRNSEDLCRHWVQSYEEQEPDAIEQVFRPAGFKPFPPSRFRMQYKFACNGTCESFYLSPDDAHRFEPGTWSIDPEDGAILRITAGGATATYRIAALTEDLLRIVPIEAGAGR